MRLTTVLLWIAAAAAPAVAGELRVGAAAVAITPPVGTPMAGYYSERAAAGVHDDLFARAIVLEQDGVRAALVALDLITTPRDLVADARAAIAEATGLRGEDVMISATHAHTGPVLSVPTPLNAALGGQSERARSYRAGLPARIAEAVKSAQSTLTPAGVAIGRGHEDAIAFNRRYLMTDGTVGWNPGKRNPRVLKPAGPIDPEVPIVVFEARGPGRKPVATYVNYAVHLDNVGGVQISADLPATLARLLGEVNGPDMVTLFTAGCCGDVNHIDVNWAQPQGGFGNAARMGTILAAEVLRTWPKLRAIEPGALRVRSTRVELPLPRLEPGAVEAAREVARRHRESKGKSPSFLEAVQAYKVLDVAERDGRPLEVEVQVVALGDEVAWVSLPGEVFAELGLAIKRDSPFRLTVIAELANGSIGYIPARRAYAQGNYEVVSARCAEGSGEILVATAQRLLWDLYRENARGHAEKP